MGRHHLGSALQQTLGLDVVRHRGLLPVRLRLLVHDAPGLAHHIHGDPHPLHAALSSQLMTSLL
eukprot:6767689-Pyramimonas_sp.AAC.1